MNEEQLVKRIIELSEQYYMFGNSEVTDAEFDDLVDLLRTINPNNPLLKSVGFGISLSGIEDKEKFEHPLPMGSIDKEKDLQTARRFAKMGKWSTKIDGNSVAAYYKEGRLWSKSY
jgi:DNA ligase (NAD+)